MSKPLAVHVIHWIDSCIQQGWTQNQKLVEAEVARCISVGFLIHEDDERVVIAGTVDDDDKPMAPDAIVIPTVAITARQEWEL